MYNAVIEKNELREKKNLGYGFNYNFTPETAVKKLSKIFPLCLIVIIIIIIIIINTIIVIIYHYHSCCVIYQESKYYWHTKVYRKPTNTDVYLNWSFHAPTTWKRGTLRTIINHAYIFYLTKNNVSAESYLREQIKFIVIIWEN